MAPQQPCHPQRHATPGFGELLGGALFHPCPIEQDLRAKTVPSLSAASARQVVRRVAFAVAASAVG
jgi:hypothetical protein